MDTVYYIYYIDQNRYSNIKFKNKFDAHVWSCRSKLNCVIVTDKTPETLAKMLGK